MLSQLTSERGTFSAFASVMIVTTRGRGCARVAVHANATSRALAPALPTFDLGARTLLPYAIGDLYYARSRDLPAAFDVNANAKLKRRSRIFRGSSPKSRSIAKLNVARTIAGEPPPA